MLAEIKKIFAEGALEANLVEAITLVIKKILAYIAGEEGYNYAA